jgi:uncharacterized protein with GYD domain
MSYYIILWKFTDEGIMNLKGSPKRAEFLKDMIEKAGGKIVATYYTMGL